MYVYREPVTESVYHKRLDVQVIMYGLLTMLSVGQTEQRRAL